MKRISKKILIITVLFTILSAYVQPITNIVLAEDTINETIKNNEENEIQFGNSKIKEYLMQNCDFDNNGIITESDMLQVENLYFWDIYEEDIDLTGLEYAKNLKSLQFYNFSMKNSIENNIEVFKNFSKLENLSLGLSILDFNELQDINPILANITTLKTLDIMNADFRNVDFSKFNQLEELYINNVKLNNIEQISGLKNLRKLRLNNYFGLSDFENLPIENLTYLTLTNANVNNINFLLNNNKLISLELDNCNIDDLDFLKYNTNLEYLSLNINNIENISILADFSKLNYLSLNDNYISDITPLKDLEQLKNLSLYLNPINPNLEANAETIQILENRETIINLDEVDESEVIEFKDEILKKKIIEEGYDKNKDKQITANEMKQIYYLDVGDYENLITDISALRYAINLTSLTVFTNCNDLTSLENLTNVTNLSIINYGENKITDISAISNLKNLQYLTLAETNITDITPLKNLTNLTSLYLYANNIGDRKNEGITDISALANLKELQHLNITNHSIKDITVLKDLENLISVRLYNNKIEDISSMSQWKSLNNLTEIDLSNNQIKDISQLPNVMGQLEKIIQFSLHSNPFEDISVIEDLKKLDNFSSLSFGSLNYEINLGKIERNSIQKIQLPNIFKQVEEIYSELIWSTSIHDDFSMDELQTNLNENIYNLDTSYYGKQSIYVNKYGREKDYSYAPNKISSISITINFEIECEGDKNKEVVFKDENLNKVLLEKHDIDDDKKITEYDILNLTYLNACESEIKDLTGIEQASNLRSIELYGNKIRDISPLMNLENLETAELSNNEITDITCLKNRKFKHIYAIGFHNNYIDFSNNSENTKTYLDEWQKEVEKYGASPYYKEGKELLCDFASRQKYGDPDDINEIVNMDAKIKEAIIEQLNADTNCDGQLTRKEMNNAVFYDSDYQKITLDLSNLNLTDLSGLEYLTYMQSLDISHNKISNLEPLNYLFGLMELDASNNCIENIDSLPYYKTNYYAKYNFSNNNITDISCIGKWVGCDCTVYIGWRAGGDPNLREIEFDFSNNEIEDITVVKDLRCLAYMDLSKNKITDISILKDYNFELNPNAKDWIEGEELYEGLNDFRGINLKINDIDVENEGNKLAIEVFENKGVDLLIQVELEKINIVDEETNVQISTMGENTAKIQVEKIQEESEEYKEISEQLKDYEILFSADISIVDGEYDGSLNVTIPVDESLNNKYVKVLHKKNNGTIEEFISKIENACVSVKVNELSPFYVAYNENIVPIGDINADGKVNIKDWNRLYNHINETSELIAEEFERGDLNKDGKVNIKDWNRMYDHITEVNPLW